MDAWKRKCLTGHCKENTTQGVDINVIFEWSKHFFTNRRCELVGNFILSITRQKNISKDHPVIFFSFYRQNDCF